MVHVLEHDVHRIIEVVKIFAPNKFVAREVSNKTGLVDHLSQVDLLHVLDQLHQKDFVVAAALHMEHIFLEAAFNAANHFPVKVRVALLDFNGLRYKLADLFKGP